jgi:hypothetical protein
MAAMADRDVGGLVARGLYMEEELFCREPLPFPDALLDQIDQFKAMVDPDKPERAYAEVRFQTAQCGFCHERFESLALGFERYDGLGRYSLKNRAGHELRADGWISAGNSAGGQRVPYRDVADYMRVLRAEPNVQRCLTKKQLQFALGRLMGEADKPTVDEIHAGFLAAGGTYPGLARAIAASPAFRFITTSAQ